MLLRSGVGVGAISLAALSNYEIGMGSLSVPVWSAECVLLGGAFGVIGLIEARRRANDPRDIDPSGVAPQEGSL